MWSICCSVALSDMFTIMAMTFPAAKNKSRDPNRGFGGIFELSLFSR
jgi:hypothetical protein